MRLLTSVLTDLKLRHFRCFDSLACEFAPGMNVFVGPNAQGKTSLLEAACVLLRLQSPRVSTLAHTVQHEQRGFLLDGHYASRHMQVYFGTERKKLALDSVEQKSAGSYLELARVVYFTNADIDLVRGGADGRRKFLDFVAAQSEPGYRRNLRAYERALRSRNHLLKAPRPNWREIVAFDKPLIETGTAVNDARARLVAGLRPHAKAAQSAISSSADELGLEYLRGSGEDFAAALEASRDEDQRLRQTGVGPHRDDVALTLHGRSSSFASEGQQRSIALALKLAQGRLLEERAGSPPLLLLDDVFGELDPARRNALLRDLPAGSQQFVTTTNIDWMDRSANSAQVFQLRDGKLSPY